MPIRVACSCGKTMTVKDEFAGKAIRCPSCRQAVRVPAPSAAKSSASAAGDSAASSGGLGDLFEEEGLESFTGPTCPVCGAPFKKQNTVICTQCGTNLQTGQKLAGAAEYKAQVSEHGNEQLDMAVQTMKEEAEMQKRTLGAGMPWWFLATMLLFLIVFSVCLVAIINAATAEQEPAGLALVIKNASQNSGVVWGTIIAGLVIQTLCRGYIVILSFKESAGSGFLTLFLWHHYLGKLGNHPVIGLIYSLGFFSTLCGIGLAVIARFGV